MVCKSNGTHKHFSTTNISWPEEKHSVTVSSKQSATTKHFTRATTDDTRTTGIVLLFASGRDAVLAIALYHNIEYFIPEMLLRFFVVPGTLCPNKCTSWRCSRRPQNKHRKAPASSWLQISWCWYLEMTPCDTPNGDPLDMLCYIKRVKWDEVRIHMQPG